MSPGRFAGFATLVFMTIHPSKLGAGLALLGVALGAFGAHMLGDVLAPERLDTFETAVRYQMYHALGLVALGALPKSTWRAAPFLFWGSVVFSGSLYLLVSTGIGFLGAITPIGGILQIIGWGLLVVSLPKQIS